MARVESSRRYWETVGAGYDRGWEHPAMRALGDREMEFVRGSLHQARARTVLDIGIGNGRVIETVLQSPHVEAVYGVDIAGEMVEVCRARFAGEPRVKELRVCDLAGAGLPFAQRFDFATAIRVLKYERDWPRLLSVVAGGLTPGGRFLFTLPNRNSLNRYSRYPVTTYPATGYGIV
jgi:SAM-dependent methyltransferase